MSEKILGYALLAVGLIIVTFAGISVYSVFTGRSQPAALFSFDGISIPLSALMGESVPASQSNASIELLPPEILNKTTNTIAHLFLMGFLVTLGAKVASTGTYLIRPIIIKAKDEPKAIT